MPRTPLSAMKVADVYPLYVKKALRKNRSQEDVDRLICWLTGYDADGLRRQIESGADFAAFFAAAPTIHIRRGLITGVVCGVRIEDITDPVMRDVRCLDKLIDELAKGRALEKIMRS